MSRHPPPPLDHQQPQYAQQQPQHLHHLYHNRHLLLHHHPPHPHRPAADQDPPPPAAATVVSSQWAQPLPQRSAPWPHSSSSSSSSSSSAAAAAASSSYHQGAARPYHQHQRQHQHHHQQLHHHHQPPPFPQETAAGYVWDPLQYASFPPSFGGLSYADWAPGAQAPSAASASASAKAADGAGACLGGSGGAASRPEGSGGGGDYGSSSSSLSLRSGAHGTAARARAAHLSWEGGGQATVVAPPHVRGETQGSSSHDDPPGFAAVGGLWLQGPAPRASGGPGASHVSYDSKANAGPAAPTQQPKKKKKHQQHQQHQQPYQQPQKHEHPQRGLAKKAAKKRSYRDRDAPGGAEIDFGLDDLALKVPAPKPAQSGSSAAHSSFHLPASKAATSRGPPSKRSSPAPSFASHISQTKSARSETGLAGSAAGVTSDSRALSGGRPPLVYDEPDGAGKRRKLDPFVPEREVGPRKRGHLSEDDEQALKPAGQLDVQSILSRMCEHVAGRLKDSGIGGNQGCGIEQFKFAWQIANVVRRVARTSPGDLPAVVVSAFDLKLGGKVRPSFLTPPNVACWFVCLAWGLHSLYAENLAAGADMTRAWTTVIGIAKSAWKTVETWSGPVSLKLKFALQIVSGLVSDQEGDDAGWLDWVFVIEDPTPKGQPEQRKGLSALAPTLARVITLCLLFDEDLPRRAARALGRYLHSRFPPGSATPDGVGLVVRSVVRETSAVGPECRAAVLAKWRSKALAPVSFAAPESGGVRAIYAWLADGTAALVAKPGAAGEDGDGDGDETSRRREMRVVSATLRPL